MVIIIDFTHSIEVYRFVETGFDSSFRAYMVIHVSLCNANMCERGRSLYSQALIASKRNMNSILYWKSLLSPLLQMAFLILAIEIKLVKWKSIWLSLYAYIFTTRNSKV